VSLQSYSDILHIMVGSINLVAGTNLFLTAAVPAHKIHVYNNLSVRYVGTVANVYLEVSILSAAVYYNLYVQTPPVSNVSYDRQGEWVLKEGDQLALFVYVATLNDDCFLWATGYTVDLT
jgi:hypothetical protein